MSRRESRRDRRIIQGLLGRHPKPSRVTRKVLAVIALACLSGCDDPADMMPPAPTCEAPARSETVYIGDSITYLMSPLPYPQVVAGIPGERSDQIQARFDADVVRRHPKSVVILAGGNDLLQGRRSTEHVAAMAQQAADADICVVLATVLPCDLQGLCDDKQAWRDWNSEVRALASMYGYHLADYYAAMAQPDGSSIPGMLGDGVHESAAGLQVMLSVANAALGMCP